MIKGDWTHSTTVNWLLTHIARVILALAGSILSLGSVTLTPVQCHFVTAYIGKVIACNVFMQNILKQIQDLETKVKDIGYDIDKAIDNSLKIKIEKSLNYIISSLDLDTLIAVRRSRIDSKPIQTKKGRKGIG